jgi:hypothetical protein
MLGQRPLDLDDSRECECEARDDLDARAGKLCGKARRVFRLAQPIGARGLQAAPRVGALQPAVEQICRSISNPAERDLFGHPRGVNIRFGEMRW